ADRALIDADGNPAPPVVLHPIPDKATAVARITAEIVSLIHRPPALVKDGTASPLGPGDVFVLTRSTKESNEVAAALRAAGVPGVLYQQGGLLQSAEAGELLDVRAAVEAPRDPRTRRRAFATRFFDVSLAELPGLDRAGDDHPYVARL